LSNNFAPIDKFQYDDYAHVVSEVGTYEEV